MPSRDAHAVQARVWCPRCCLEELLGVLSRCRRCCRLLSSSCYPLQVLPGVLSKCRRCCRSCRLLSSSCCPLQVLQSIVAVQALGRAVVHAVKCCRVLLLSRPWGELLSMLSGAAECCCCPSATQQLQVLQVLSKLLSSSLVLGVEKEGYCCPRA